MKRKPRNILFSILILIVSLIYIFPVFWTFTMSFKERGDIFTFSPPILPSVWTLDNYREVFSTSGAIRFFANSLFVATATTIIVVILSTTSAYGIQRLSRKQNERISNAILLLRMIPAMVLTIPFYLLFKKMGWINSLPALIMCYVAVNLPLAIWLCRGFYHNIPDSIYEAAVMDGASEFQLFKDIGLPLIVNSIIVIALQTFFAAWNELSLSMILISKEEYRTMAVGIKYWTSNTLETPYARMAAAGMICIIPTAVITVILQNYLVKGFVTGAVKG